jgi:hypothetical protein
MIRSVTRERLAVTTHRIERVEREGQEAQAISEAAAKAIALRPIPLEAIRSGATVAAAIAIRREQERLAALEGDPDRR